VTLDKTELVVVRCALVVRAREKGRKAKAHIVTCAVPVRVLCVPAAEAPAVARVSRETFLPVAPYRLFRQELDYRMVGGVLMRPVLAPDGEATLTVEALAGLSADGVFWPDHPAPWPFVHGNFDPVAPLESKAFVDVDNDAVVSAQSRTVLAMAKLRFVDGVLYRPALPPAYRIIEKFGAGVEVDAVLPDYDDAKVFRDGGTSVGQGFKAFYVDPRVDKETLLRSLRDAYSRARVADPLGGRIDVVDPSGIPDGAFSRTNVLALKTRLQTDGALKQNAGVPVVSALMHLAAYIGNVVSGAADWETSAESAAELLDGVAEHVEAAPPRKYDLAREGWRDIARIWRCVRDAETSFHAALDGVGHLSP
jgi:hypothetical protein